MNKKEFAKTFRSLDDELNEIMHRAELLFKKNNLKADIALVVKAPIDDVNADGVYVIVSRHANAHINILDAGLQATLTQLAEQSPVDDILDYKAMSIADVPYKMLQLSQIMEKISMVFEAVEEGHPSRDPKEVVEDILANMKTGGSA